MTTLIYIFSGLMGATFMMLLRMRSLKEYFKSANQPFVLIKFFKDDSINILLSVMSVFILSITIHEMVYIYPKLENFVRTCFVLAGAIGDYVYALAFSKSKKHIRKVISDKINDHENKDTGLGDQ